MTSQNQRATLLSACSRGDVQFLKDYIEKNGERTKFQIYDNHNWGPLHHAVISNSLESVRLLLKSQLVDIRWKSYEGHTCLYVAIDRGVLSSIVKLLLKEDPELFNIPDNEKYFPIHKAISRNSLDIVQAIIQTLNEMNFPINDQFDLEEDNCLILAARQKNLEMVKYILEHIKCDIRHTNDMEMNAVSLVLLPGYQEHDDIAACEIFKILLPMTYDLEAENSMQIMMWPLVLASYFSNRRMFNWLVDNFYLTELNDHHRLVRRLMDSFQCSEFDFRMIIIGLHSQIKQYLVKEEDQIKNDMIYKNIITDLISIFRHDCYLFTEMIRILKPKIHVESFKYAMMKFIPTTQLDGTDMANDLIQMFDIMSIDDLIDIGQLLFFTPSPSFLNNVFLLFMPFSNVSTADVYLNEFTENRSTELMASLQDDLGLSRFCVNGSCRMKNTLKSLCRQVIRASMLNGNGNNNQRIKLFGRIKSINLPNRISNYLMFNYTDYEFK